MNESRKSSFTQQSNFDLLIRPGQGAHVGRIQHRSPSPGAREARSLSLSNHSYFPSVAMLQSRKKTKTRQTRAVAVYLPLYQAVTFPEMIDRSSLRFCFDQPLFQNEFSELAPRPQHSVQKTPQNGMQNLPFSALDGLCVSGFLQHTPLKPETILHSNKEENMQRGKHEL